MKEIKNILVASELNKESYEALAYGITLSLMFGAKVSCIHVIKPSPIDLIRETFQIGSDKYGTALKAAKEESQNLLGHIIDVISQELGIGEIDVDLKIVNGSLTKSITEYADTIHADLVVIGTEPGAKFIQSQHTNLALSLIDTGRTNVLLIPSGFKMERIEQIGAFINFDVNDIQFIYKLINLADKTEHGLKCINVAADKHEAEKMNKLLHSFERLFADAVRSKKIIFEVAIGELPSVVNSLKENYNLDLMVIRVDNRHWDLYAAFSSFSDRVIKNIRSPLLVWKKEDVVEKKIVIKEG